MFLRQVLGSMFPGKQGEKIIAHKENEEALHLAYKPLGSAHSEHIDVGYRFLRNEV